MMIALDVVEDILLPQDVKDLVRWKSVYDKDNKQLGNRRIDPGYCSSLNIEGSSNGLVCISSMENDQICVINPSTREFRILQDPITLIPNSYNIYGFGYDSSADAYKLVMAIDQGSDGTLVQILSLKSNVWKLFGRVNYRFYDGNPGILFNGSLHWFCYDANASAMKEVLIVSFDLAKEEFREIPQPEDSIYHPCNSKLGIFEDHLCILPTSSGRLRWGIWVMRNYNVKQSWELLPYDYEMKNRVHFMDEDCRLETPSYFCCDEGFSDSGQDMPNPIFVQTLVSPYVNDKGKRKKLATQEENEGEGEGGTKKRTRNKNNSEL